MDIAYCHWVIGLVCSRHCTANSGRVHSLLCVVAMRLIPNDLERTCYIILACTCAILLSCWGMKCAVAYGLEHCFLPAQRYSAVHCTQVSQYWMKDELKARALTGGICHCQSGKVFVVLSAVYSEQTVESFVSVAPALLASVPAGSQFPVRCNLLPSVDPLLRCHFTEGVLINYWPAARIH